MEIYGGAGISRKTDNGRPGEEHVRNSLEEMRRVTT